MLLHLPDVLTPAQVSHCRQRLEQAAWVDGRDTAGQQSASAKQNLQLPEQSDTSRKLGALVLDALGSHARFFAAALPRQIYPPLFNCYSGARNQFGNHVDNAVRTHAASGRHLRTDLSFTLFLSEPEEYDGGELVIEDTFGQQRIKLPAGHMVLYPSSSLHRVEAVTRGARICCFSWLQSMVRDSEQRRLLYQLDGAICSLRGQHGELAENVALTACYHNLVRMWAEL